MNLSVVPTRCAAHNMLKSVGITQLAAERKAGCAHFPLTLEQLLLGRKFDYSQTGMLADCELPEQAGPTLDRFLQAVELKRSALEFARRYSFLDSTRQAEFLGEHLHRLVHGDAKSN